MKLKKIIKKYRKHCRRKTEKTAAIFLQRNCPLSEVINEAKSISDSHGLSDFEYVRLYQMVRELKPEYTLECGTGKSTFVIAHAMSQNGNGQKIVSMEQSSPWADSQQKAISHFFNHPKAKDWFPGASRDLIELDISDSMIIRHRIWAGSCYKNIQKLPYSFMLVDGPQLNNDCFVNIDIVNILRDAQKPVNIFVDGRWPTVVMCRGLFGEKVISKLGWTHTEIYGATKDDLDRPMEQVRKDSNSMIAGLKFIR